MFKLNLTLHILFQKLHFRFFKIARRSRNNMIVELKGGVKNNSLPCRRFWMGASAPPLFPVPFVNFEIRTDDLSFSGIDLQLFPFVIVQRSETRMSTKKKDLYNVLPL